MVFFSPHYGNTLIEVSSLGYVCYNALNMTLHHKLLGKLAIFGEDGTKKLHVFGREPGKPLVDLTSRWHSLNHEEGLYCWCCFPKGGIVYPVCDTPVYPQGRGIVFIAHLCRYVCLGDNSTELAPCLAESQGLYTLAKTKNLLVTFQLVHRVIHSPERYIPSLFNCTC